MSFTLKTSDRNITTPGMVRMRKDEVIRLQLFIPLIRIGSRSRSQRVYSGRLHTARFPQKQWPKLL